MSVEPFEVYNPMGGRWFILHWWTDDERGHLAFAASEHGLLGVSADVFKKEPHAEIKAVLEIEIVGPSDKLSLMAAEHDLREKVDTFYYVIFGQLGSALKKGMKLPSQFVACDKYEPEEGVDDDDWARTRHYGCKNCLDVIRMVGMTKEDLYWKHHDEWHKGDPEPHVYKGPKRQERSPSKAPKASDDEPLWFAHANFGDHAGGVEIHEVELPPQDESYRPKCLSDRTLFFFRKLREVDGELASALSAMCESAKATWKEESEVREASRKKEFEQEERDRHVRVITFFDSRKDL